MLIDLYTGRLKDVPNFAVPKLNYFSLVYTTHDFHFIAAKRAKLFLVTYKLMYRISRLELHRFFKE